MTSYSARALYQRHYHDFAQALDLIWCQTEEIKIEDPQTEVECMANVLGRKLGEAAQLLLVLLQNYQDQEPEVSFAAYVSPHIHNEWTNEGVIQFCEEILEAEAKDELWKLAIGTKEELS